MSRPPLDPRSLRDTPETDKLARLPHEQPEWEKFIGEIKHLLVDPDGYGYAEDTLRGILATVERTQQVTEGQRNAISNIGANPGGKSRSYTNDLRRRRWEE